MQLSNTWFETAQTMNCWKRKLLLKELPQEVGATCWEKIIKKCDKQRKYAGSEYKNIYSANCIKLHLAVELGKQHGMPREMLVPTENSAMHPSTVKIDTRVAGRYKHCVSFFSFCFFSRNSETIVHPCLPFVCFCDGAFSWIFLAHFTVQAFIFHSSDLRFNHIKEVPSNAFRNLNQLHSIFLNENQISTVGENAFKDLSALRYLYLNQNHIKNIAANAFNNLTRLERL